jgi:hypothetical protein
MLFPLWQRRCSSPIPRCKVTYPRPRPPCHVHLATPVGYKILNIGGCNGDSYYNNVYVCDILIWYWSHLIFPTTDVPMPWRTCMSVLYQNKAWVSRMTSRDSGTSGRWAFTKACCSAVNVMRSQYEVASTSLQTDRISYRQSRAENELSHSNRPKTYLYKDKIIDNSKKRVTIRNDFQGWTL